MSDAVFGAAYSSAYDLIYGRKNYDSECDLVERMFTVHARRDIRRVLDVGCGTGRHSCRLAARGYSVVGVDRSEDMLRFARARADDEGVDVTFVQSDARSLRLDQSFDGALLMFAVLGYQTADGDVVATLRGIREHLMDGAVLVFDVWYGPAVIAQAPEDRWRIYSQGDEALVRHSSGSLDPDSPVCTVDIEFWSLATARAAAEYGRERHEMRYFDQEEIAAFLEETGYELTEIVAFPEGNRPPDTTTWNILVAACTR